MRKERYNLDDLMMQMRECSIGSVHEIAYAILETNGKLTLLKQTDCKVKYPFPLIQDGKIQKDSLIQSKVVFEDILQAMKKNGIENVEDVFLCLYTKNGFSFIKRSNLDV